MEALNFNPFPNLSTERLSLTRVRSTDFPIIFELRSNPEIIKFIKRKPYTKYHEAKQFIKKNKKGILNNEWIMWGLRICSDDDIIGTICLWNFNIENEIAEIGYDLIPEYQGKGFMSEAMNAVINFGFNVLNIIHIEAFTDKRNQASKKILQKFAFIKQSDRTDKVNLTNEIYSLCKV